jgi:hypothetical protein
MARLALRELWISFRLFAVLAGFVAVAALVALLPAPLPVTLERLALGLGAATCLTAGVAAWSMAEERQTGRAGWLVTRSLPRGTLLVGWFVAVAATSLLSLVAAAILGWLAASNVALRLAAAGYISAVAGVGATLLAAVALGLLAGTLMRVVPAALLVVVLLGAAIAVAWLMANDPSMIPGGAYAVLARLEEPGTAIGPGLRAAGIGLAVTAAALVAARLLLERAEL